MNRDLSDQKTLQLTDEVNPTASMLTNNLNIDDLTESVVVSVSKTINLYCLVQSKWMLDFGKGSCLLYVL